MPEICGGRGTRMYPCFFNSKYGNLIQKWEVINPRSPKLGKVEGKLDFWLISLVTLTVLIQENVTRSWSVALAQQSLYVLLKLRVSLGFTVCILGSISGLCSFELEPGRGYLAQTVAVPESKLTSAWDALQPVLQTVLLPDLSS